MKHASNQTHFATVPKAEIPRAKFKRDFNLHTTMDAGYLVPIFVDEVLPADTFILRDSIFGRLSTPLKPIMDNLYLDTFYFFVPSRLVWSNWQKFNGEKDNPADSTTYLIPTVPVNNVANGSLFDYMGIPTQIAGDLDCNALPLRAYKLIYHEWFRDQNLQNSTKPDIDDGPDLEADYTLLQRGKRHDYFTSCLTSPQKGTAVSLPLGTVAPLAYETISGTNHDGAYANAFVSAGNVHSLQYTATPNTAGVGLPASSNYGLYADLTNATAATINEIREAFQVQRLYERDARGGTRYIEILQAHFGVTSPDQRLQRPEYLGGSSTRIGITPVANTSATATENQGDLAAMGTVAAQGNGFTQSFTEHGYIIGLASIRADLNYQQGLNRMWSRQTRFDYYWPALAHLGEQAVLNKEIYADASANDELVFGYQERYAEYKYKPNLVTGKFRSNDAASLDLWHLALDFSALPALNSTFIVENPPMSRVLAVTTEPHLILDAYFDLDCIRPMPMYSVPGLVDHF